MNAEQIEDYLATALDQEVCKPTLVAALTSRVVMLQQRGITTVTLIECLENLGAEPDQLNSDVIEAVMDWLLVISVREKS